MVTILSAAFAYVGCAATFYAYLLVTAQPMPEWMEAAERELEEKTPPRRPVSIYIRPHHAA